jgi:hypothetical protein
MINIDEKPEFAKLFYSTAFAAQASKRNVVVQIVKNNRKNMVG